MHSGDDDKPGRIGKHWLSKRPGSPNWHATWFDKRSRQTRRASLSTEDFEAAQERLAEWITLYAKRRHEEPEDTKLADLFARYWQEHGQTAASAVSIRRHLEVSLECLDGDIFLSEFGLRAQDDLVATLRKRGFSPGGVKRIFASVKASIIYAWRREEIKGHPPFISLAEGGIRERILSIEELAALWDVCAKHHMQFFFIGLICTMARPNAVLALTTGQCDTARGIIDLHPIGRPRTKKRNPVIPLPDAMRPWLAAAGNGQFVTYADRGIHDVKKAWRAMRNDAGLDDAVVPYSIRHTMASELAARGVPELQIAAMLGHKAPNLRTTNRYIKFRPDYLAVSRKVIDEIVVEMGRLSTRPIVPEPSLRANCVSVTQDEDDKPLEVHEKKKKAPNSGEGWALLRFHACVGREADAERSMPSARRGGTTDGDWHQSLYAR